MKEMDVRVERLKAMRAVCTHVLSDTPEEDAGKRIREWARSHNLTSNKVARLFGRNTYPTDKPEPHGYELYLTVDHEVKPQEDFYSGEVPAGLYAVLRFRDLHRMGKAWSTLWNWIEELKYEHVGFKRNVHGWFNGFEEHINWSIEDTPQTEWMFDLWIQLKE